MLKKLNTRDVMNGRCLALHLFLHFSLVTFLKESNQLKVKETYFCSINFQLDLSLKNKAYTCSALQGGKIVILLNCQYVMYLKAPKVIHTD